MELPKVEGRQMLTTISQHERACLVHLMEEQEKISPNNALVAVLCDSVRLCREYLDVCRKV